MVTDRFLQHFGIKAAAPAATTVDAPLSIYVHWPWCLKKCPYCDFNSHGAARGVEAATAEAYTAHLRAELADWRQKTGPRQVVSIFFGGGTPTLMGGHKIGLILNDINSLYGLSGAVEITVEGNPTSAGGTVFRDLQTAGVNRLSLGVQALEDADLHFLGREHDAAEARTTLAAALAVFDNVNADLMYGLPGQDRRKWAKNLTEIARLGLAHVSAYQLTIEPNTAFYGAVRRGRWQPADSDIEADFCLETREILAQAGYALYEVSNHAQAGRACRHNLAIWRYGDYLGIGAGAHGRLRLPDGRRVASRVRRSPEAYLAAGPAGQCLPEGLVSRGKKAETPAKVVQSSRTLAPWEALQEAFMLGLRLPEGVDTAWLARNVATDDWESALDYDAMDTLLQTGMLEISNTWLRTTEPGSWHLDRILRDLLR